MAEHDLTEGYERFMGKNEDWVREEYEARLRGLKGVEVTPEYSDTDLDLWAWRMYCDLWQFENKQREVADE